MPDLFGGMHPASYLIIGGLLCGILKGRVRDVSFILFPILGFINLLGMEHGTSELSILGYDLVVSRVDKLSLVFGYLFHIAALITSIYSLHTQRWWVRMSGVLYAASAVGAVFAGDLITLFVFWELLAVTSVFQIWARGTKRAIDSGIRYLIMHISSGLLLLAGAAAQYHATGSLLFEFIGLSGAAGWLIFIGFGVKCAFPFFHTWLVDSYPESTPAGSVYLCAFTTKVAVYAMARGYPGTELLIWIGAAMAMFPIFYAVIENDLRRVLGYSMINQIGFMMVGIGIGTAWGINGAVAHAFNDVLFKGLLFMTMGAVLYRTGRINGSDLGGLYKSMPWTAGFCMVGAASISAFPLFSGFVSKSMIMSAAGYEGYTLVWCMLLFAAAGVFHHAGIKIPFFAFYAHDSGIRTEKAPLHMRIAMGIAAALCIGIGCFPGVLYDLLPITPEKQYHPYTITHVITQTQLLFFSALAFVTLMLFKIYPPELRSTNLDVDWFYRKGLGLFYVACDRVFNPLNAFAKNLFVGRFVGRIDSLIEQGPARLAVILLYPIWKMFGLRGEELEDRRNHFYEQMRLGAFPIGLTAFLAVILFGWLFFF